MILNAFDSRCCVSGLRVRELLVASHIVPWSDFPNERLNPQTVSASHACTTTRSMPG
jgi:hypothetical protein